ncbi:MAG: hypothetical protein ACRBFS_04575 [Aureispira sp.]
MNNFNLEAIWDDEQPEATAYFEQVAPQLQLVIKQGSQHTLQKLRRTILIEWLVGLLIIGGLLLVYREEPFFLRMLCTTLIVTLLGIYPYWNLWRTIIAIPTQSLRESLVAYLKVIRLFIKRIHWFCLLGTPIGAALGLYLGLKEAGSIPTLYDWLWIFGLSTIVGIALYLPIRYWYVPMLYGRTEKRLEELLAQLQAEN